MTHAELRIVEFLITSNATELVDLPDWFLALVEGEGGEERSEVECGVRMRCEKRRH